MNRLKIVTSISTIVLTSALFVNTGLVLAQQSSPASVSSSSPNANLQQRCQTITAKISTMITNSQARLQKRQSSASTRTSNVQKRIQNLQSRGADITKLQSDVQQLTTLLNQWISDYQLYITKLQATQSFTCGDSQGKFKQAVQDARNQLKVVRQDGENLKSFTQGTLQPDFQTARQSVKGKKGVGNSTSGSTSSNNPAPTK